MHALQFDVDTITRTGYNIDMHFVLILVLEWTV